MGVGVVIAASLSFAQNYTLVSLNKPATASSIESGALSASKAFDGIDNTRWSSQFLDGEWLTVDLQQSYAIDKIELNWESAFAQGYEIYLSNDGSNWGSAVYSTTNSNGGTDEIVQQFGLAQYIRIVCVTRATQWGSSLFEMKVFKEEGSVVHWLGDLNAFPAIANSGEAFYHTIDAISYIYDDDVFKPFSVGQSGAAGDKGDQGNPGIDGVDGLPGVKGDRGVAGVDGLPGAKGDRGVAGVDGLPGAKGDRGVGGVDGLPGAKGDRGVAGVDGLPGAKGDQGERGIAGPQGPQGDIGPAGTGGTTVVDGSEDGEVLTWESDNWIAKKPTNYQSTYDNMQPWLGVNYIIALQGTFPSRNSSDPFLAEIIMFAGNFAPRGWALCDGQLMAISQYSAVFSLLGTTYGGDGRTVFALPDLRGRVAVHPGSGPGLTRRQLGAKGGSENINLITQ